MDPKKMPPGAMVEMDSSLIDEGKFISSLNRNIRKGHRELREYLEESGDKGGKVVVMAKVVMKYDKEAEDFVIIEHAVKCSTPVKVNRCYTKERGGLLLCQPGGASSESPDQQRLFMPDGTPISIEEEEGGATLSLKRAAMS